MRFKVYKNNGKFSLKKTNKRGEHLDSCQIYREEDLPPSKAQKLHIIEKARDLSTESPDFGTPSRVKLH